MVDWRQSALQPCRRILLLAGWGGGLVGWLLIGCAQPTLSPEGSQSEQAANSQARLPEGAPGQPPTQNQTQTPSAQTLRYAGRFALNVPGQPEHSVSASFELTGQVLQGRIHKGQLRLLNPLGQVEADLNWSEQGTVLVAQGKTQHWPTLGDALAQTLSLPIGVDTLLGWLQGQAVQVPGWQVVVDEVQTAASDARESQMMRRLQAKRLPPDSAMSLRLFVQP